MPDLDIGALVIVMVIIGAIMGVAVWEGAWWVAAHVAVSWS